MVKMALENTYEEKIEICKCPIDISPENITTKTKIQQSIKYKSEFHDQNVEMLNKTNRHMNRQ